MPALPSVEPCQTAHSNWLSRTCRARRPFHPERLWGLLRELWLVQQLEGGAVEGAEHAEGAEGEAGERDSKHTQQQQH